MKNILFAVLVVVCSLLGMSGCDSGGGGGTLSEETKASLDDLIKCAMLQKQLTGVAVTVTKNGKPIYQEGFGHADISQGIGVTNETSFPIGSVTKTFTTIALMQLIEQGFASLDDPIGLYLPDLTSDEWKAVTIRELLSMSSGIPQNMVCNSGPKQGETCAPLSQSHPLNSEFNCGEGIACVAPPGQVPYIDNLVAAEQITPLLFEPGTEYLYINMNFVLAGLIVESISGLPFETYLYNNVLEPLGMLRTAPSTLPLTDTPNSALAYRHVEEGEEPVSESFDCISFDDAPEGCGAEPIVPTKCVEIPTDDLTAPFTSFSAGYLTTTQIDMVKYEKALHSLSPMLLDKESYDQMWTNAQLKNGSYIIFGLGWVVCSSLDEETCPAVDPDNGGDPSPPANLEPAGEVSKVVQKDGGVAGFHSQIVRYLDDGVTVIVFVNTQSPSKGPYAFSVANLAHDIGRIVRDNL